MVKHKKADLAPIDWTALEPLFKAGVIPLTLIAAQFGCSRMAIHKHARKRGWERAPGPTDRERAHVILPPEDTPEAVVAPRAGYLYVVFVDDTAGQRFYKIGMSWAFSARFKDHQCASPFDVKVALAYFTDDMAAEESLLHTRFAEKRVRGEWFRLSREDLQEISLRCLLV